MLPWSGLKSMPRGSNERRGENRGVGVLTDGSGRYFVAKGAGNRRCRLELQPQNARALAAQGIATLSLAREVVRAQVQGRHSAAIRQPTPR